MTIPPVLHYPASAASDGVPSFYKRHYLHRCATSSALQEMLAKEEEVRAEAKQGGRSMRWGQHQTVVSTGCQHSCQTTRTPQPKRPRSIAPQPHREQVLVVRCTREQNSEAAAVDKQTEPKKASAMCCNHFTDNKQIC